MSSDGYSTLISISVNWMAMAAELAAIANTSRQAGYFVVGCDRRVRWLVVWPPELGISLQLRAKRLAPGR